MEQARCPRCGYDQHGVVTALESNAAKAGEGEDASFPLRGVCSECGLEFAWGSLLNPKLRAAEWLFEHVRGAWRTVRASLRNGVRSLRGGKWWRRVQLEHVIKPRRLDHVHWLLWVLVLEAGFGVVAAVFEGWIVYNNWLRYCGFTFNPATGRYQQQLQWTSQQTGVLVHEASAALVWPWPRALSGYSGGERGWFEAVDFVLMLVIAAAVTAGSFMLLPVTMARVKVRWVHLVRGFGHAAPVVAVLTLLWVTGCAAMSVGQSLNPRWSLDMGEIGVPDRDVVLSLVLWALWGVWWWRYTRDYLRLPRAGAVAIALVLIGLMTAGVLARPVEGVFAWAWGGVAWVIDGVKWATGQ